MRQLKRHQHLQRGRGVVVGRTHDVTISAFDLDRLEAELAAVTEQRDRLVEALRELWDNHTLYGAAYELIEKALAAVEGGSDE